MGATIMLRRGMGCLLVLAVLLCTGPSWAQTKMTIATGVDPVFSAYYVAQQAACSRSTADVRINRALGLRDGRLPRERPDRVRLRL